MEIAFFDNYLNIFEKNKINGLININCNFIAENFNKIENLKYNSNLPVSIYLKSFKIKKNKYSLNNLIKIFELDKSVLSRDLKSLSNTELNKVLLIKALISNRDNIHIKNIEFCLNDGNIKKIVQAINDIIPYINKTIIIESVDINKLVSYCSNIIIVQNSKIIFNDNKYDNLPIDTEINKFVKLANQKNANLSFYKDPNDLLKGIYRSVTKEK